jgi:hypothetical protein
MLATGHVADAASRLFLTISNPINSLKRETMASQTTIPLNESQAVAHILQHCRHVAVVGLSPKAHRDSYRVAEYMQAHGWRIIPINPIAAVGGARILGERVFASLTDAAQHEKIDLVDVFRHSDEVPPVVEEAIAIRAPAIWLQLGIRHDAALQKARDAGMVTVQNLCLKVEHHALALS